MKNISYFLVCCAFLCSCSSQPQKKEADKPCLLVYCGITMVKPMREVAKLVEQDRNCKVTMMQGGSEDLYQSLKLSKKGDLYLPGSSSYRQRHLPEGLLGDYIFLGYNQAALLVAKNNPKNISPDINNLAKQEYRVAIGNAESGSIGRQAKKILSQAGIYEQVLENALQLPGDSRTLNILLTNNSVDLILNWRATAYFASNEPYMSPLLLDETVAPKNKLQLNLLTFSQNQELARYFMKVAGSPQGQEIFARYGFLDSVGPAQEIKQ